MDRQKFTGLLDMLNGGGPGQAGDTFEGGPLSALLNALGVRPRGFADRMEQSQAQAQPQLLAPPMAPRARPPAPMPAAPNNPYLATGGPITQSTLPPIGQMSNEQLMAIIRQALEQAPSAIGYGRR